MAFLYSFGCKNIKFAPPLIFEYAPFAFELQISSGKFLFPFDSMPMLLLPRHQIQYMNAQCVSVSVCLCVCVREKIYSGAEVAQCVSV